MSNLDFAQLYGAFKVFEPVLCNELKYSVVPVSYNDGSPTAVSVIRSIDTVAKKFLVESGFIRQVGRHKFKL